MDSRLRRPSPAAADARRGADRLRGLPLALLATLLILKYAANLIAMPYPVERFPNGDAAGYVLHATHLYEHGVLPRADAAGSTYHPPGYATLLAPFLAFGQSHLAINRSTRWLNSAADLALVAILYALTIQMSTSLAVRLGGAAMLGLQPWTSRAITLITPDTVAALLLLAGAALLYTAARRDGERARLIVGSALVHSTFLLRAEMILLAPLLVGSTIVACRQPKERIVRSLLPATVPLLAVVVVTVGYWSYFQGRPSLFGHFEHKRSGLVQWTESWAGPPRLKNGIVMGWYKGDRKGIAFEELPAAALGTPSEAARLRAIYDRIEPGSRLSASDGETLGRMAAARIQRDPWRFYVWPRLYNGPRYWFELDRPIALTGKLFWGLRNLAGRPLALAAYVVLKTAVLVLTLLALFHLSRRIRRRTLRPIDCLVASGLLFAAARTAFLAHFLSHVETRLVIIAWPFVLLAACYGLAETVTRRPTEANLRVAPELSRRSPAP